MFEKGEKHFKWKGGLSIDAEGYVWVKMPYHPDAATNGYIRRSRWLMERHIGRRLTKTEVVHHINNVPGDDRIENLRLKTQSLHTKDHRSEEYSNIRR